MSYTALYRTYRPQTFKDVVGQEVIVKTLQNAIASGKTTHAYLFSGPRGTGKTTIARIFAKALNCEAKTSSEPCCECTSCREIALGISPDVIEIDAASNNGVDEIRDIRDKVKFMPGGSKYKIYIIDEVHMLTQGAFNALLKTLEEPPEHVIFVLATTEPHKVLPTIVSRCQRYDFKSFTPYEISSRIRLVSKEENIKISDEAIIALSESAEGGMRDALSYLDQAISFSDDEVTIDDVNKVTGNLNNDKIIEIAQSFEQKEIEKALLLINELVSSGKEITKIVSSLLNFYRDVLLYKNADVPAFSKYIFEKESFKEFASEIAQDKIFYYVDVLGDVQNKIKFSQTPYIFLEIAIIKMIKLGDDELKFMKKIEELETKIKTFETTIPDLLNNIEQKEESFDDTKFSNLDEKINKIASELSKLELPKLSQKVEELSQKKTYDGPFIDNTNEVKELKEQQEQMQEALQLIKVSYGALKNQVDNTTISSDNIDTKITDELNQRLIKLENAQRESLAQENQTETASFDIEGLINKKLEDIIKDSSDKYSKCENKINNLEEKLLSNDNKNKEKEVKETTYYKDSEIEKISNNIAKENVNFGNIQKENTETPSVIIEDKKEEKSKEESVKTEDKPIDLFNQNFDFSKDTKKFVREISKEGEKIIIEETPSSQFVRLKRDEKVDIADARISVSKYQNESRENTSSNIILPKSNEEYSAYKVSIIERILKDAMAKDAIADKGRILSLWNNLTNYAPFDKLSVAEMLEEGEVVAVGNCELIIMYSSINLCNQVMKLKFKNEALRFLNDLLKGEYNYIALPKDVWLQKRAEYIGYMKNSQTPKLTEINIPQLNVEKENKEYLENEQDKLENRAYDIFGSKTIKFK